MDSSITRSAQERGRKENKKTVNPNNLSLLKINRVTRCLKMLSFCFGKTQHVKL